MSAAILATAGGCGGGLGGPAREQPPPDSDGYSLCESAVDVAAENRLAIRTIQSLPTAPTTPYEVLLVPGYVPLDEAEPVALHPVAKARLDAALSAFFAGWAPFTITSGGAVHPEGTPYNEALEMKRYLLAQGMPEHRILVEPCARHSHTNLRNAGRLMLRLGLSEALVVTSPDQAYYFAHPLRSSFTARSLAELGYVVGELKPAGSNRASFTPSPRCLERGPDPRDP